MNEANNLILRMARFGITGLASGVGRKQTQVQPLKTRREGTEPEGLPRSEQRERAFRDLEVTDRRV